MHIIEWLEEEEIEYWTDGKNVSQNWINIKCPFCEDSSNHCGINLDNLRVSCWICGKHSIANLILEITHCSFRASRRIARQLSLGAEDYDNPPRSGIVGNASPNTTPKNVNLPRESTLDFPKIHIEYLRSRGFTPPLKFIKKYKLLATHTIGKYRFRIIIPVYMNHKIVSFTSRDVTDQQDPKYLNAPNRDSQISIKNNIYNYDNLKNGSDAILVEGPLDVWKLGDSAVSLIGVKYTDRQIILLKNKMIRNLFIMFDNDIAGVKASRVLARIMAPLVNRIEIIKLQGINDPGELTVDEASILKYQLGFKTKK